MASIDFFGVDLTDDRIRFAEIKGSGSLKLEKAYVEEFSSESMVTKGAESSVAESIKEAHKRSGIGTRNCVVAIPEQRVFSRMLILPKVAEEKNNEAIAWALKPLLPTDIENVSISYVDIAETVQNGKKVVYWYAVAAPKQIVSIYQTVFRLAGLNLLAIETETLALARFIDYNYRSSEDLLLVDIGKLDSNVVLARNGITLFSQSIGAGMSSVDRILATDFGADEATVNRIKDTYGDLNAEDKAKILRALEPVLSVIASEISRTLVYYKQKIAAKSIQTVYLAGFDSLMPILSEYLRTKMTEQIIVANPVNQLKLNGSVKKYILTNRNASQLDVAIGLAMKGSV